MGPFRVPRIALRGSLDGTLWITCGSPEVPRGFPEGPQRVFRGPPTDGPGVFPEGVAGSELFMVHMSTPFLSLPLSLSLFPSLCVFSCFTIALQSTESSFGMPLTLVIGSSGSGKTTFLEHVHKLNQCCYIRQYHLLRPYIPVQKIPSFDPTQLPYWSLYSEKTLSGVKNLSYNPNIMIGGTLGADFVAGLSGGQRKMMLFELVKQRTTNQSNLLITLDEPFAGVDPISVQDIKSIISQLSEREIGVLITDHNVRETLDICEKAYIVSEGCIIAEGTTEEILSNEHVKRVYLGDDFRM